VDWIQLVPEESMTGHCDHADEPSVSTKGGQFFWAAERLSADACSSE